MNVLCAFSSDSRELYIADIYRVLSLPKDHHVHFRYKAKYVEKSILESGTSLKGQKVAIFFTHGNSGTVSNSEMSHIPIRWAYITNAEKSDVTDVFHVYMKLADFCDISICDNNDLDKMPPSKFLTKLSCTNDNPQNGWYSRVSAVKDFFPDMTFFHLKSIEKKAGENLIILPKNQGKSSYYELRHGQQYILKLAVANPKISETKIDIADSEKDLTINCVTPLESSIEFDDHDIPISVKTLSVMEKTSLLKFRPIGPHDDDLGEYATNIELKLKLSYRKPAIFGLLSVMAFWALLLTKPISDESSWASAPALIASTVLVFISTGLLFFYFNKK